MHHLHQGRGSAPSVADNATMKHDLAQIWGEAVERLTSEAENPNLQMLLAGTRPLQVKEGTLDIEFPSVFARDWVETRHMRQLHRCVHEACGESLELRLVVARQPGRPTATVTRSMPRAPVRAVDSPREPVRTAPSVGQRTGEGLAGANGAGAVTSQSLSPRYTFDTFVVGSGNQFAHAASLAAASKPAAVYNPLFLYGGVGLGKTHLMQAIGHYVIQHHPGLHVVYASSERFTNDLINSLQTKSMVDFRQRYRNVDVLLIDDIQFVAGKESTQEEFFHTFNALYQANKQIVISSDRPPKEIPTLEDRLRSRFEWGLTADLQAPDIETRVAILRQKAFSEGFAAPDEVLDFIATNVQSNIRELEGALNRVIAFATLHKAPVSIDIATEALKEILSGAKPRPVTIPSIQEIVASHFGTKIADMKGKRRSRAVAFPRQVAMYLSREMTDASLPRIGEEFGGRDHTTVMHACDKVRKDMQADPSFAHTIRSLMARIQEQR